MGEAKTVRRGKLGKMELRLVRKDGLFHGLADGKKCVDGPEADHVWQQLHDAAGKAGPNYFGFDGARSRFLKLFPDGFDSEYFNSQERAYKLAAKEKLDSAVPLSEALDGSGFGEAVLAVFRATNLLSHHEKTWVQNMLRSPSADTFVKAAAAFAKDGTKDTLNKLQFVLRPHGCDKWTISTYLPFLWQPKSHMFLKPTTTRDFAERVGHPFFLRYTAQLEFSVYESLLDLADTTAGKLLDLNPPRSLDRIDVQSFIWVVGNYPEDLEQV